MQPAIAGCFFTGKFGQTPSRTENSQSVSQEKRIADLATDIKKSGLTTRKATIAAQTLYQTAQQYGPNAEAMLAAYEPGQDPKRFASGFQNSYIAGTLGNPAALGNSKAAGYLTEEQRELAYSLGAQSGNSVSTNSTSEKPAVPRMQNLNLSTDGSTIEERRAAFRKAFMEGQISTRISPQKQARHILGTRQFQEYDAKLSARGDHPSYLREDLSEDDLNRLVMSKLQGKIEASGKRTCEFVTCDESIGFYYSKVNGCYIETHCAQVIYAVKDRNVHIIPVKRKDQ